MAAVFWASLANYMLTPAVSRQVAQVVIEAAQSCNGSTVVQLCLHCTKRQTQNPASLLNCQQHYFPQILARQLPDRQAMHYEEACAKCRGSSPVAVGYSSLGLSRTSRARTVSFVISSGSSAGTARHHSQWKTWGKPAAHGRRTPPLQARRATGMSRAHAFPGAAGGDAHWC